MIFSSKTFSQTFLFGVHYQKHQNENPINSTYTLNLDYIDETYTYLYGFEVGTNFVNFNNNNVQSFIFENQNLFNDVIKTGLRIGIQKPFFNVISSIGLNFFKQYKMFNNSYGLSTGINTNKFYYKFSINLNKTISPELGYGSDGISLGLVYKTNPF